MRSVSRLMSGIAAGLIVATLSVCTAPQSHASVVNGSFETGDLTGWTAGGTGGAGASGSVAGYTPLSGSFFGYVVGGAAYVYTTLSQTVTLEIGETISGYYGYRNTDDSPYVDDGYLSVDGTHLADFSGAINGYGANIGWNAWSFTAATAGSYTLQLAVRNTIDSAVNPYAFLDNVAVTTAGSAVPLPATLPLFAGGLGALGLLGYRRKRKNAAALAA
jgi:hypothetical protein